MLRLIVIRVFILLLVAVTASPCLPQTTEQIETIKVDADLVDLKVSVVNLNPQNPLAALGQEDFKVFEDGQPQEISFFAAAETPFDLVLLLDVSGSTQGKLGMIRKSAKRFVEATRPIDRVSVVSFAGAAQVVCPLTQDRDLLRKSIDKMDHPQGGTVFWDSLRNVLAILNASKTSARRTAVVVMTDGVDNALPEVFGDGSQITFDELIRIVRTSESMVFPIYLDTEDESVKNHNIQRLAFAMAREQLAELAVASGTRLYRANRLQDLDSVYKQVIGDLGRVYSIGYRPTNVVKDGKWRAVSVQVIDRNDVLARTKQGYFSGPTNN